MRLESDEQSRAGIVFDIKRFSVHDGPGIRTTVFLKGCPLRCLWCSNPESQAYAPQIIWWPALCLDCGACLDACSQEAIIRASSGSRRVVPERCSLCGACLQACHTGALEQIGRFMSVEEVIATVEEDDPFFRESDGGATLSGGEPAAQPEFGRRILQALRERGIRTAIDTCGYAPWEAWSQLLPHTDVVLYDLKEIDDQKHCLYTGVSNEIILRNFRRMVQMGKRIIVRRPVIPGYNDDMESTEALARFLASHDGGHVIHLLPYHRYGASKYSALDKSYALGSVPSMAREDVEVLRDALESYGFHVEIDG